MPDSCARNAALVVIATVLNAFALATGASAQTRSQAMVYGENIGPLGLNPYAAAGGLTLPTRRVLAPIYEPLFRFDYNAGRSDAWLPVLATGYRSLAKTAQAQSVFAVDLRQGVTWHDGTSFTADDVVFTYRYLLEGPVGDQLRKEWRAILVGPPRKVGPHEVVFEFREPESDPRFYMFELILPASRFDARFNPTGDDIAHKPLGTGPFQFVDWQGEFPLLRRYPRYHGKPTGNLGGLVGRKFSDATTMVNSFTQTDAVNVLVEVPTNQLPKIQALANSGAVNLDQLETYNVYVIALRQRPGSPFNNERVRRAVTMAIDRRKMLETFWLGSGEVLASPMSSSAPYYDAAIKELGYDAAAARDEIRAALGGSMPRPLKFVYPRGQSNFDTRVLNAVRTIKESLEALGFRIEEEVLDEGVYDQTVFRDNDFDLAWMQWRFNPAYSIRAFFHSSEAGPGGANVLNFRDQVVDQLLDAYDQATDVNTRRLRASDLQRQLNAKAPAIFLLSEKQVYAYQTRFTLPPTKVDPFDFFPYAADWSINR